MKIPFKNNRTDYNRPKGAHRRKIRASGFANRKTTNFALRQDSLKLSISHDVVTLLSIPNAQNYAERGNTGTAWKNSWTQVRFANLRPTQCAFNIVTASAQLGLLVAQNYTGTQVCLYHCR